MDLVYNTQLDFASNISNFLSSSCPHLRKTQLNIIPYIIFGMINAESSVSSDIAKHLKDHFSLIQFDSVVKRIRRFFNNKLFDPYLFYHSVISFVISNYKKKHSDKRVHVIIDHMFSHNNYTVLMFSLRIGKQGIPLWFRCFDGHFSSESSSESIILEGINYCLALLSDFDIIFLADRWFNSTNIMKTIHDAGHTFVFRLKKNIKVFIYDKKEKHNIWKFLDSLPNYECHSVMHKDILLSDSKFKCSIVLSKRNGTDDPWILATNGNYRFTIKDYSYRFGTIEFLFKNQKSNGFYIETINNSSLKSFSSMYSLVCFAVLFCTIVGTDFSKNTKCYKNIKIETHKTYKIKGKVRVMSLFNVGLTLLKRAFYSSIYIRIPYSFTLYDI